MHILVALRALERCMDVVRLLCIRSGIVFEGLISHCRHSSLTWLDQILPGYSIVPDAMYLFGPVAESQPRRPQLHSRTLKSDALNARRMSF